MELDEVPVKDYQPTMQSNYENSSNININKQQSKQHVYEKLIEELKIYEQNYKEFENKYKSLENNFNNILIEKQELKKTLVEQITLNQKLHDHNFKLIKPLVETLEEKDNEIQEKEKEIQELKLKNTDTSIYQYVLEPDDNSTILKKDVLHLQDSLKDYVTKCKGNVEIKILEVQKLLKKYGSGTVITEQDQNKPLIRAVLQRHVIQQIFIYAKEYFGDPEKHNGNTYGAETIVYKKAKEFIELISLFVERRIGLDDSTNVLPIKLRQQIFAALGNGGFNDMIDNNKKMFPHGFICRYQRLLNEEIDKYRRFKNPERKKEIEGMAGSIIKKVVTLFWFRLNVQEPIANYAWFKYDDKIDPNYMEGKWGKDEIDNIAVDICYFPLIAQDSSKCCIYTPARIFHKSKQSSSSKDLLNSSIKVDEITEYKPSQTITVNSIQLNYNPSNNPQNNTSFPIIIKDFIEDTKQEIEKKDRYIQFLEVKSEEYDKLENEHYLMKYEFNKVQEYNERLKENNDKLLKENQQWKQDFMKEKSDHERKLQSLEAQYNDQLKKEFQNIQDLEKTYKGTIEESNQWVQYYKEKIQEFTKRYKELQLSYDKLTLEKQNMEQKFAKDNKDYEKNINNSEQHINEQNSSCEQSTILLKKDILHLQDVLEDYTKCKGNVEINIPEVQKLMRYHGSKTTITEQDQNRPLIKAVLQCHVIRQIFCYADEYFDNPEDYGKLSKIETIMYNQAKTLVDLTNLFAERRTGVDDSTILLPIKLRQQICTVLGNRGFNDIVDKNKIFPHEFISRYQDILNEEIAKYRRFKDPEKQKEIEGMAGSIIKEVITLFQFRLKVQEPIANYIWFKCDNKIDPIYMEGKWEKDDIDNDNIVVDICYFPLIAQDFNNKSKRHIYTPARIFHKSKQRII